MPFGAAGLLHDRGNRVFEMHPALGRFLRLTVFGQANEELRNAWSRTLVGVIAQVADRYVLGRCPSKSVYFIIWVRAFTATW